jgi:hypothetical protein
VGVARGERLSGADISRLLLYHCEQVLLSFFPCRLIFHLLTINEEICGTVLI